MGNLINHLSSTKDSGDPEPWWASLVRVGTSSTWPDIFPQASLHLVQLWLAVSVFYLWLGFIGNSLPMSMVVEPKDKTGLNPYHNKYLFLSEGRASPIYLCIFVRRQVGFQCICNWKKITFLPRLGSGGLEACACQSYLQLMQFTSMCERIFCFVKRILAVMFTQYCIKSTWQWIL